MDYGSWTLQQPPVLFSRHSRAVLWDVCFGARLLLDILCRVARFVRRDAKIPTKITRSIYHDLTEYAVSYYIAQADYLSLSLSESIAFILVVSFI